MTAIMFFLLLHIYTLKKSQDVQEENYEYKSSKNRHLANMLKEDGQKHQAKAAKSS